MVVTDAAALRDARQIRRHWLVQVRGRDTSRRAASLSATEFRRRLKAEAARYGFTIVTARFLRPQAPAPLVILRTDRYVVLARAIPTIEKSLDPHRGSQDWSGWRFRAFFLEAEDERGVPFVVVTNVVGNGSVTGGQWARSDALFPFQHG